MSAWISETWLQVKTADLPIKCATARQRVKWRDRRLRYRSQMNGSDDGDNDGELLLHDDSEIGVESCRDGVRLSVGVGVRLCARMS